MPNQDSMFVDFTDGVEDGGIEKTYNDQIVIDGEVIPVNIPNQVSVNQDVLFDGADMDLQEFTPEQEAEILARADSFLDGEYDNNYYVVDVDGVPGLADVKEPAVPQDKVDSQSEQDIDLTDIEEAVNEIEAEEVTEDVKAEVKANPFMRKFANLVVRLYNKMQDMGLIEQQPVKEQVKSQQVVSKEKIEELSADTPDIPKAQEIFATQPQQEQDVAQPVQSPSVGDVRNNSVNQRQHEANALQTAIKQFMNKAISRFLDTSDYSVDDMSSIVDKNMPEGLMQNELNKYLSSDLKTESIKDMIGGEHNSLSEYVEKTKANTSFIFDGQNGKSLSDLTNDKTESDRLKDTADLWNKMGDIFADASNGKVSQAEMAKLSIYLQQSGIDLRKASVGLPGGAESMDAAKTFDSRGIWLDLAADDQLMMSRKGYNMNVTGEFLAHMGKLTACAANGELDADKLRNISDMLHSRSDMLNAAASLSPMERHNMCREMGDWGAPDKYNRQNVQNYMAQYSQREAVNSRSAEAQTTSQVKVADGLYAVDTANADKDMAKDDKQSRVSNSSDYGRKAQVKIKSPKRGRPKKSQMKSFMDQFDKGGNASYDLKQQVKQVASKRANPNFSTFHLYDSYNQGGYNAGKQKTKAAPVTEQSEFESSGSLDFIKFDDAPSQEPTRGVKPDLFADAPSKSKSHRSSGNRGKSRDNGRRAPSGRRMPNVPDTPSADVELLTFDV